MSLIALITDLIYHAEHKLYCDLRETYYLPLITIETMNTPNSHLAGILDQQDLYYAYDWQPCAHAINPNRLLTIFY